MDQQNRAYMYAGTAVLMWSTVGSAFKLTLRELEPIQMLLFSAGISIIVLLAILIAQKKLPALLAMRKKDIWHSSMLGLLNPFLFYIVLFYAYDLLLTQEAMVLNFTWPVTLTVLSMLILKQRIGWKSFVAILVSFTGILVIATNGKVLSLHFSNIPGVLLALGSTFIWSLFWIFNIRDKRDEVIKLFLNFFFGFFYILLLTIILGKLVLPGWKAMLGVFYIGTFEMGVAYVLWLKGLQLSSTTAKVSNLIFFAPFISLIIINLTVGEPVYLSTLAGLAFIVGGIVMQRVVGD